MHEWFRHNYKITLNDKQEQSTMQFYEIKSQPVSTTSWSKQTRWKNSISLIAFAVDHCQTHTQSHTHLLYVISCYVLLSVHCNRMEAIRSTRVRGAVGA